MDDLKTLDEKTMEPPVSRIGTATNCGQFVFRLSDADQDRSIIRTRIKGNIDGNAPYKKAALEARGLGDRTNLNFRQGAAIINQFKVPYYDLAVEVPLLCDIRTAFGTSTERGEWSQIISEEYDRMVKGWEDWDFVLQFSQFQMLVFGIGQCFFPDTVDWRPDVAKIGDVLVNDGARSRMSELDAMVILKNYTAPDLYRYIRNKKVAEDLGWNVEATERAIIEARYGTNEPVLTSQQYEWYQQKFKNADIFYGTYDCQAVRIANVLIKEFDERISHHIVRSDRVTDEFIYSRIGRFDSMDDVAIPFFYDIGDGTWHSINGIGKEIYAYCKVFDMLRCREVDGAMIASSILLQNKDSSAVTKAQLLSLTNLSIIPANFTIQPTNIGQGIEATTGVRRDMETSLGSNIGVLQNAPNSPNPRKGQKQAILEMQQRAQLGKGNINRWYTQYDKLHQKMFGRASRITYKRGEPGWREAMMFQARCVKRGVPLQALAEIDEVKAYRSIGAGSAANALMVTEAIMEHLATYPEEGKREATKLWLSRLAGQQTMTAIMGETKNRENTDDAWEATMENNALRTGGETLVTKLQSNVLHLEIHLDDTDEHTKEVEDQAAQQGMSMQALQGLVIHLDAAGKHCLIHLNSIKDDESRANDYKELQKRWQMMARIADKARQQLTEMMQQEQQKEPQADHETMMELLKNISYKDAPESVKAQMETAAGAPRAEGDVSVPKVNLDLKAANTEMKADKERQRKVLDDVDMNLKVRKTAKELSEPAMK